MPYRGHAQRRFANAARNRGGRLAGQQTCASAAAPLARGGDSAEHSAPVKQRRRRTMEFFCGLDETAVCVVDDHGVTAHRT
ncbi:hypothetical protein CK222_24120 [Mesorhizobium sp. WSM3866]|nr:hypothetical protein CK222_24120 [Mesorhizobium sp. WSM3866]